MIKNNMLTVISVFIMWFLYAACMHNMVMVSHVKHVNVELHSCEINYLPHSTATQVNNSG
jgi:hypothetical protein